MKRVSLAILVGSVALAVLVSVVIDQDGSGGSMEVFTEEQAFARVDAIIHDAVKQMDPQPELEDMEAASPIACERGGVMTEKAYRMIGLSQEHAAPIFDSLHDYWRSNGYEVTDDRRSRERAPILKVRHRDDSFSVALRQNIQGGLSISGSSPCIELQAAPLDTYTEAALFARIESHVDDAVDQVTPRPRRGEREGGSPRSCQTGGVIAEGRYPLEGLTTSQHGEIFDTLFDHWKDSGYEIVGDLRDREPGPVLTVTDPDDGFTVGLKEVPGSGDLVLEVSSPCVEVADSPSDRG